MRTVELASKTPPITVITRARCPGYRLAEHVIIQIRTFYIPIGNETNIANAAWNPMHNADNHKNFIFSTLVIV